MEGSVASTVFDTGEQQVAALYAKALLGATQKAGTSEQVLGDFDAVIKELLDPHPRLQSLLGSAGVSHEEKLGILDRAVGDRVSPLLLNFMKVLSSHGRLSSLRAVHSAARKLYDEMQGRTRVQVKTAHPLSPQMQDRVKDRLRGMMRSEAVAEFVVDPQLIGGIVFRIGDRVYDGSVATRLEKVRQKMIDRSLHEIQSRRDSFSYPEGN